MKIYLLQAAVGFGILLYEIAKALLFFGIPILTIILTLISINKRKETDFSTTQVLKIIRRNFLYSILSLLVLTVGIIVLLLFTVDLSYS